MAEIFQYNPKKAFNIAGKTQEEAMKYLRYLHRNALFGTHTGLPPQIKNSKMNESLVSNIGDYSVIDVYAKQLTKCVIGTVVNFSLDDTVNPLGETYVYPCTDKNKPMGYMISDATPDTLGVCLVHGVLEVPLYYFGEEGEKKNYVEYDLENKCFKFSDSGYPVFNVYQDVDGDWIAIILFGDVSSDYEYDGPFAVSVAGVTGSTTYVNVNSGDVLFNDIRGTYDEDLITQVALNTGESVWLKTSITGNTHAYDLIATSTTPIDGSTVFYTELAKNVDGNIVQNQYGDIRYSRTKLIAGSNRIILSPANGLGDVTIDVNEEIQDLTLTGSTILGSTASIGITDSTSKISIISENDLYVRTGTGTNQLIIGSTTTAYTNVSTSVSGATDASISFSNINGLAKTVHIKAGSNVQLSADGNTGIIVSATGGSVTPYVQDLSHSFSTGTATLGLTGSAITVSFTTAGNTYIEEGDNGAIIIGSTSGNLMCASTGTTGLYSLYVSDTSDSKVYLKAGTGISLSVSGSTITITNDIGLQSIKLKPVESSNIPALYLTGDSDYVKVIAGSGITTSIENGHLVISSTITPVIQNLTSSVSLSTGTATIGLTGSTSSVVIKQGSNMSITEGTNGEIILGSTNSYTYTGSFAAVTRNVTDSLGNVTHYVDIVDTKSRDHYGDYAGFVHLGSEKYSVNNYTTSFVDGDVIYLVGTFSSSSSNNLSLAFQKIHPVSMDDYFPTINDNQFCVRICYAENGKMIQAQYGDIVQPARYVGDGTTAEVIGNTIFCIGGTGATQDLTSTVTGETAFIGITGSSSTVNFISDGSVDISGTTNTNEIKLSVSGGTSSEAEYSTLVTGGTEHIQLHENKNYVIWVRQEADSLDEATVSTVVLGTTVSYTGNMFLELPVIGNTNSFYFITLDNRNPLNALDVVVLDTEQKGISDSAVFYGTLGNAYISTGNYKGNAFGLDAYKYMFVYDPVGVLVEGTNISVHWFILHLD